jgi:hypothetical protein
VPDVGRIVVLVDPQGAAGNRSITNQIMQTPDTDFRSSRREPAQIFNVLSVGRGNR